MSQNRAFIGLALPGTTFRATG